MSRIQGLPGEPKKKDTALALFKRLGGDKDEFFRIAMHEYGWTESSTVNQYQMARQVEVLIPERKVAKRMELKDAVDKLQHSTDPMTDQELMMLDRYYDELLGVFSKFCPQEYTLVRKDAERWSDKVKDMRIARKRK